MWLCILFPATSFYSDLHRYTSPPLIYLYCACIMLDPHCDWDCYKNNHTSVRNLQELRHFKLDNDAVLILSTKTMIENVFEEMTS